MDTPPPPYLTHLVNQQISLPPLPPHTRSLNTLLPPPPPLRNRSPPPLSPRFAFSPPRYHVAERPHLYEFDPPPLNAAAFLLPPSSLHRRSIAPCEHRRTWKRRRLKPPTFRNSRSDIEGWGNLVDDGGEDYVACTLVFHRRKPWNRKRNSPGNEDPGKKRGGFIRNRTGQSLTETSSERNRLNSSPAIQESEEVDVEDIVEGENPQKKRAVADHMHVRVSIKDPNNNVYQLKSMRYVPQGSNGWETVATDKGLKVEDSVAGNGNTSSHGTFKIPFYFLKKEPVVMKDDDAETENFEEATEIKENDDDANSVVGQLVKCEGVVKKIVEREERKKGYESFVWFRAEDKKGVESEENGVDHQWREVVAANCMKLITVCTSQTSKRWKITLCYYFFHFYNTLWYYFLCSMFYKSNGFNCVAHSRCATSFLLFRTYHCNDNNEVIPVESEENGVDHQWGGGGCK